MIRALIIALVVMLVCVALGVAAYAMIKLHATVIIRWKNIIEDIHENGGDDYATNDDKLADLIMLCCLTLFPVVIDATIFAYLYMFFGSVFT